MTCSFHHRGKFQAAGYFEYGYKSRRMDVCFVGKIILINIFRIRTFPAMVIYGTKGINIIFDFMQCHFIDAVVASKLENAKN